MTQQALSKARTHFDHSPFLKAFYEVVNAERNPDNDANLPRRYGYKFLAVDGSIISPPNLPELKERFWDVKGSPSARADIALEDDRGDFARRMALYYARKEKVQRGH